MTDFMPGLPIHIAILIALVVWGLAWKGVALWRAGRNNHLGWFIAIFLVNTIGILEMVYIFAFSRRSTAQAPTTL